MYCKTCFGIGEVIVQRKSLKGVSHYNQECFDCRGTGEELPKTTIHGVDIIEHGGIFIVNDLLSEFCSKESAVAAIESVHKDLLEFNEENPEDEFPNLPEYCRDYLAEQDYSESF